jgi:uncharacterized membrane protein (DUF106 family)
MSSKTNQTEEIDLGYLFKKIGNFFKSCVKIAFEVLYFFLKFKFIVLFLLILGVVYGYYKDSKRSVTYDNKVIVIPNFESTDYLYNTVEAINFKVRNKDTVFLKQIAGNQYRNLRGIQVEPITDIYNFISETREKIDVFRILFQNQDLTSFVEDIVTSKHYKYHVMNFRVVGEHSETIISNVLDYLNANEHYLEYAEVVRKNTALQIEQHEMMISRVDSILSIANEVSDISSTSFYYVNQNISYHQLIEINQKVLDNHHKLVKKQKDESHIIKLVSAQYNLIGDGIIISNKVKYPLLFVFLFSMIFFVRYSYNRLKKIAESN